MAELQTVPADTTETGPVRFTGSRRVGGAIRVKVGEKDTSTGHQSSWRTSSAARRSTARGGAGHTLGALGPVREAVRYAVGGLQQQGWGRQDCDCGEPGGGVRCARP